MENTVKTDSCKENPQKIVAPVTKKRCCVFIDGFNLYFGVLEKEPASKWLNIQSFFEELRKDDDVQSVLYFSAQIDPRLNVSTRRDRQKRYFAALKSLPKVDVILGKYQDREVTCRASCREKYRVPEEKKTDVNIAVSMMEHAIKNKADLLVLVSGDSDLEPAIKWIRVNYPTIKIWVYIPAVLAKQANRRNDFYPSIQVQCKFLPLDKFQHHQINDTVTVGEKVISRPPEWN